MVEIPKKGEEKGLEYEGVEYMEGRPDLSKILSAPWREHQPLWPVWFFFLVIAVLLLTRTLSLADPFVVFLIIFVLNSPLVIRRFWEYERGVVLRLGKFHRIEGPGWCIIWPIVEEFFLIDLRLEEIIIKPKEVITKEKVRFKISLTVFMYVTDPKRAALNVYDYKLAVVDFVIAALTRMCGSQNSDYIVAHMQGLSRDLEEGLAELASVKGKEWGVMIPRVEIDSIEFPEKVQTAMHNRVAAEQQKLAAHEQAEATKVVIDAIQEAGSKLTDPAITYLYLQALDKMSRGRDTKMILPLEVSKIAETITKSTGKLAPDQSKELQEALSKYEGRIKELEGALENKEGEKALGVAKATGEEREEEYKKKIEEIKKRIKDMEK